MSQGRPPLGAQLVDGLEGSEHARQRLKVLLKTLSREMTVEQACQTLGVGEAMFHKLRTRMLREALAGLEPRPVGRPAAVRTPEQEQIAVLTEQIAQLQSQLETARIREEVALARASLGPAAGPRTSSAGGPSPGVAGGLAGRPADQKKRRGIRGAAGDDGDGGGKTIRKASHAADGPLASPTGPTAT